MLPNHAALHEALLSPDLNPRRGTKWWRWIAALAVTHSVAFLVGAAALRGPVSSEPPDVIAAAAAADAAASFDVSAFQVLPAYPPARHFPPSPPLPRYHTADGLRETAYVVFMRHGERGPDKSDNGLTTDGTNRAIYMNRCITDSPSVAFPNGPPTRLLASTRGKTGSHRPLDTLTPIATRLNLSIETADMMEIYSPLELLPSLKPHDTLLIVWQHWFMPRMIAALQPPTPTVIPKFPQNCPGIEWKEPDYAQEADVSDGLLLERAAPIPTASARMRETHIVRSSARARRTGHWRLLRGHMAARAQSADRRRDGALANRQLRADAPRLQWPGGRAVLGSAGPAGLSKIRLLPIQPKCSRPYTGRRPALLWISMAGRSPGEGGSGRVRFDPQTVGIPYLVRSTDCVDGRLRGARASPSDATREIDG